MCRLDMYHTNISIIAIFLKKQQRDKNSVVCPRGVCRVPQRSVQSSLKKYAEFPKVVCRVPKSCVQSALEKSAQCPRVVCKCLRAVFRVAQSNMQSALEKSAQCPRVDGIVPQSSVQSALEQCEECPGKVCRGLQNSLPQNSVQSDLEQCAVQQSSVSILTFTQQGGGSASPPCPALPQVTLCTLHCTFYTLHCTVDGCQYT